jgi:pyridoxal phosphate enzyme (YggS family)
VTPLESSPSDTALTEALTEALVEARQRYAAVQARIAAAAERAGRSADEITLVGVAKRQPLRRVLAAIESGVHVLGQSYVQEAREVRPEIETAIAASAERAGSTVPDLRWRMVGRLQRNKAALAVRLFDAVESVDRLALAETLSRHAVSEGRDLEVLIQVSLCGEDQKGGCRPEALPGLAEAILGLPRLRLEGLMTVPAAEAGAARPAFARLRELREDLSAIERRLATSALSMGMSGDLEVAIEEGATLVRVGTALFGERNVAG